MPLKDITKRKAYMKEYARKYFLKNRESRRKLRSAAHRKWRAKNAKKMREYDRVYYLLNRKRLLSKNRKTRNQYSAHNAVGNAIKNGKLRRPTKCDRCSRKCKPEAHHHRGYEKEHWLDVIWLCRDCHESEHH